MSEFILRIPRDLESGIRIALAEPHRFASERIGFIFTRASAVTDESPTVVVATAFEAVPDEDYIPDPAVGARIGARAIRSAMQRTLDTGEGVFLVHCHAHCGIPRMSAVDRAELRPLISSIRNARPETAHGLVILSDDSAWAEVLSPAHGKPQRVDKLGFVGFPTQLVLPRAYTAGTSFRFSRQSFLGPEAEQKITGARVGIVGLGGGGSHIAQQLAHLGFLHFWLSDSDTTEDSNLNRLVGATQTDATRRLPKVNVATRQILGVNPEAKVQAYQSRWQERVGCLRGCDIVFGCVDSYAERRDLEILARRNCIPYIDIGMDVHQSGGEPPRMAGQILVSMPGRLCMWCLGFLTEDRIAREAQRYGAAGPRPQVVWANGVLASTAVGIAVDLLTDWTHSLRAPPYLSYDSNLQTIEPHKRLLYLNDKTCSHFPAHSVGAPRFTKL
jgi:hypothetical protein